MTVKVQYRTSSQRAERVARAILKRARRLENLDRERVAQAEDRLKAAKRGP